MPEIMNLNHQEDQTFLKRLTTIVEANPGDENFGVSELAEKSGLSRSRLYFRVKSITQKSVSQFIREIRMKKALRQGYTFISFSVGNFIQKMPSKTWRHFHSCL